MTRTDKKREQGICRVLTHVCEQQLKSISGFEWLTHTVDYRRFPDSLNIVCVFDSLESLGQCYSLGQDKAMRASIASALAGIDIILPQTNTRIGFDTEEACTLEHKGNWQKRLGV